MNIKYKLCILSLFLFLSVCCNNDQEIIKLLKSKNPNDVILGAYKAGESGDKKFVNLLLNDCFDKRSSTNIHFKGFTVYEEKMIALIKIYKIKPPQNITDDPDSTIIKFYLKYSKEDINR